MADIIGMYLPSIAQTVIALYLEIREKRFSTQIIERMERWYPLFLGLHDAHIAHTVSDLRYGRDAPETNRALVVLDRSRRVMFASPAWQDATLTHPELRDPMALALAIANKDQVTTSDGALFVKSLSHDSLLAPDGTMLVLEPRAPAQTPIDFDKVFKTFAKGKLTPRETQISRLIIAGYPTGAIAKTLGIGRGTVKNHRRRLYDRLDITTERELFSLFFEYLANPSGGVAAAPTSSA